MCGKLSFADHRTTIFRGGLAEHSARLLATLQTSICTSTAVQKARTSCIFLLPATAKWAKANPEKLERLELSTEYENLLKIGERQARQFHKQLPKTRQETIDYVVKFSGTLFPSADKVKK